MVIGLDTGLEMDTVRVWDIDPAWEWDIVPVMEIDFETEFVPFAPELQCTQAGSIPTVWLQKSS
jgi:hypothetical protein